MGRYFLVLALFCSLFVSCGSVIKRETLSQTDPTLPFSSLLKNPEQYRGTMVLLGGRIIQTSPTEGITWVEVLQQPLGRRDRPKFSDFSEGRFLISHRGFLDPAVYEPGLGITVAGLVDGKKILPLGQTRYAYPIIRMKESRLWPPRGYNEPRFYFGIGVRAVFD